jgi:hypothetical protein
MSLKLKSRRAIGRQVPTPPRRLGKPPAAPVPGPQTPAAPAQVLAAQKSDFTAEGAPPPGKVSAPPS